MKTPPSISGSPSQLSSRSRLTSRPRPTSRVAHEEGTPSKAHGASAFLNKAGFQQKFGSSGTRPRFRFVGGPNVNSEHPHWNGIPEKYRGDVEKMAKEAYETRQLTEPYLPFRERIAGLWKAQKREFYRMTQDQGFQKMPRIDAGAPFAILAMTVNGSLIAMTAPDENGLRNMRYIPISERTQQPKDFPHTILRTNLDIAGNTPVMNNHFVPKYHGFWRTSNIIAIAAHPSANQRILWNTQQSVTESIIDIRAKTIIVLDDKPE